jgi:hypothetical protein
MIKARQVLAAWFSFYAASFVDPEVDLHVVIDARLVDLAHKKREKKKKKNQAHEILLSAHFTVVQAGD